MINQDFLYKKKIDLVLFTSLLISLDFSLSEPQKLFLTLSVSNTVTMNSYRFVICSTLSSILACILIISILMLQFLELNSTYQTEVHTLSSLSHKASLRISC